MDGELSDSTQFECSVCIEELNIHCEEKQPRLLKCGHSFCFGCMRDMSKKNDNAEICCPICLEITKLDTEGVDSLRKNFALMELLNTLENSSQNVSTSELSGLCVDCDGPTGMFCSQCPGSPALCSSCFSIIHQTPNKKQHSLVELEERRVINCTEHNEECKLYCYNDNALVCLMCAHYGSHKGHSVDLVEKATKTIRLQLDSAEENTKAKHENITGKLIRLRQQEMELRMQKLHIERAANLLQQCKKEGNNTLFLSRWSEVFSIDKGLLVPESEIMNIELWDTLKFWLPQDNVPGHLLYRASRDGFTSKSFHQHCDHKGANIVIVKSSSNHIFGGFTPLSWDSYSGACADSTKSTFLFILQHRLPAQQLKLLFQNYKPGNTILNDIKHGPTFGGNLGYDMVIQFTPSGANDAIMRLNTGKTFQKWANSPVVKESLVEIEVFSVV